ncbi:sugar phosphate nucleotidyltransferase [Candidatus Aenigmatarchaeota archaeon]
MTTKNPRALVLASGYGGRMGDLVHVGQKSLLRTPSGISILRYGVDTLKVHGYDVGVAISLYGEQVRDDLRSSSGIEFFDSTGPQGTAGEVYKARRWLGESGDDFIVWYGDTILRDRRSRQLVEFDVSALEKARREKDHKMAVTSGWARSKFGHIAKEEDDTLVKIREKPHVRVNLPIVCCRTSELGLFAAGQDIMTDTVPRILESGGTIGIYDVPKDVEYINIDGSEDLYRLRHPEE